MPLFVHHALGDWVDDKVLVRLSAMITIYFRQPKRSGTIKISCMVSYQDQKPLSRSMQLYMTVSCFMMDDKTLDEKYIDGFV